jgi:hypothetical protein
MYEYTKSGHEPVILCKECIKKEVSKLPDCTAYKVVPTEKEYCSICDYDDVITCSCGEQHKIIRPVIKKKVRRIVKRYSRQNRQERLVERMIELLEQLVKK